eukprot:2833629-Amphidinium_carterae.1
MSSALALKSLPLAESCWTWGFDFWKCCLADGPDCWDEVYIKERCCLGIDFSITQTATIAEVGSNTVACLQQSTSSWLTLGDAFPYACKGARLLYVAKAHTPKLEKLILTAPWWKFLLVQLGPFFGLTVDSSWMRVAFMTRPITVEFEGSLCVPHACSMQTAAQWIIPSVYMPEIDLPQSFLSINSTHVELPPPYAVPVPVYHNFHSAYALRHMHAPAIQYSYAVWEHRDTWVLGNKKILAASFMFGLVLCATVLRTTGYNGFFAVWALQRTLTLLSQRRGDFVEVDICRICLTVLLVCVHTSCLTLWWHEPEGSTVLWIRLMHVSLSRLNIAFVTLMVFLQMSSQEDISWRRACARISRRWISVAPTVGVWTVVFTQVCMDDIPVNSLLRDEGMNAWFGIRRDGCKSSLWTSLFMFHYLTYLRQNQCHIADIYEALLLLDACVLLGLGLFGRTIVAALAGPLLILVVLALHQFGDHEHGY